MDWLSKNLIVSQEQLRGSTLVFGPGNSYYARTSKACLWNNLPPDLEERIVEEMTEGGLGPPKVMTLGTEGTWVVFWNNNTVS